MQPFPSVLCVRPARASGARDLPALETALAGLALDEHSPIALEVAATATTRQFLLRAEHPLALQHLGQQMQARYPQATISPVATDPLALLPGEACSVVELRPGAVAEAANLPRKGGDRMSRRLSPIASAAAQATLPSLPPCRYDAAGLVLGG